MEDISLDDYIIKKGLNTTKTSSVRGRVGSKPQATAIHFGKKPVALQRHFAKVSKPGFGVKPGVVARSGTGATTIKPLLRTFNTTQRQMTQIAAKPGFKKMFDARQKLSAKTSAIVVDARQKLQQKTKFGDARQRIELKKQQQQKDGVADMRMKILAKRRQIGNAPPTVGTGLTQQLVQVTVRPTMMPQPLLHLPQAMPRPGQFSIRSAPVQGRYFGPGYVGQPTTVVMATGRGQFAVRPVQGLGSVSVVGGSLKKTITASPSPVTQYSMQPPLSTTLQAAQFAVDKLRITACNEHAVSRPTVNTSPAKVNRPGPERAFSAGAVVQRNSATNVAPMTTMMMARMERSASAAETAAARIAVQAAAAASQPPVSTALATMQGNAAAAAAVETVISPLQGFRTLISNLHTDVTLDDIMELFGDIGPLKNARLVKPGVADVVFVNQQEALVALKTYNMRELDGQPMSVELKFKPSMTAAAAQANIPCKCVELDIDVMQRALFKSVAEASPRIPVNFTVQL